MVHLDDNLAFHSSLDDGLLCFFMLGTWMERDLANGFQLAYNLRKVLVTKDLQQTYRSAQVGLRHQVSVVVDSTE